MATIRAMLEKKVGGGFTWQFFEAITTTIGLKPKPLQGWQKGDRGCHWRGPWSKLEWLMMIGHVRGPKLALHVEKIDRGWLEERGPEEEEGRLHAAAG